MFTPGTPKVFCGHFIHPSINKCLPRVKDATPELTTREATQHLVGTEPPPAPRVNMDVFAAALPERSRHHADEGRNISISPETRACRPPMGGGADPHIINTAICCYSTAVKWTWLQKGECRAATGLISTDSCECAQGSATARKPTDAEIIESPQKFLMPAGKEGWRQREAGNRFETRPSDRAPRVRKVREMTQASDPRLREQPRPLGGSSLNDWWLLVSSLSSSGAESELQPEDGLRSVTYCFTHAHLGGGRGGDGGTGGGNGFLSECLRH
ncbi:unnamed protein product [Pleuronectes platessa]|uniref:Uncharacterized protein n=1 Tax=Pleuronectes platessa TaxID=8262 RepID=A0A9N7U3J3_PLEPL|nr:unnamed protein product [Pleuronectes platessa]